MHDDPHPVEASPATPIYPDFSRVRADFPRSRTGVYFDNASSHPLSVHSAAAVHRLIDWETHEVGQPWWPSWANARDDSKRLFAQLIGADPSEISFARSTLEAENNLLNGLDIHTSGGNVVTNDLHYTPAIYNYMMRQREGLDVRIVRHRDWRIDIRDMEQAVDRNTRLIVISLVSNVNGYVHDVKALSELAHAHGAYLFADINQAAGAIPIDVRAMGIDAAACSTFKWLMGLKGFGFLFLRKELQGNEGVRPTQLSGRVTFNYLPWTGHPDGALAEIVYEPVTGSAQYEVSYPSYEGVMCALESLRYIRDLGVSNIRSHVRGLTDRLMRELPGIGYQTITPIGNDSPIVSFECSYPEETLRKLHGVDVQVAMRFGSKMRISPSVYNNQDDVSRLLDALS
ncbi:MAG: aminotransferase class V-fold PLP-dependent enzyme [Candidatus Limnocylindrales bacterium]